MEHAEQSPTTPQPEALPSFFINGSNAESDGYMPLQSFLAKTSNDPLEWVNEYHKSYRTWVESKLRDTGPFSITHDEAVKEFENFVREKKKSEKKKN